MPKLRLCWGAGSELRGETPQQPASNRDGRLLERTRTYLGTVQLVLSPSSASVTLDGARTALDASNTLLLAVGEHTLEFAAEGCLPLRQTITVKGGQAETLQVALSPVPDPHAVAISAQQTDARASTPLQPAARVDTPLYKKWWLWTATGIVLVAAVTTTAVLLARDPETRTKPFESPNTPAGSTIQTLLQGPGVR